MPGMRTVAGSILTSGVTFFRWDLAMKKNLRLFSPFRWFKKGSCQLLAKEWALSTGKLPRRLANKPAVETADTWRTVLKTIVATSFHVTIAFYGSMPYTQKTIFQRNDVCPKCHFLTNLVQSATLKFAKLSRLTTIQTKWYVRPAKTHISLDIRPIWSESSLCAQWVAKDPSFLHADSEDSDQTGRMPRLIWVFAGRTVILLVLSWGGSFDNNIEDATRTLGPSSSANYSVYSLTLSGSATWHHRWFLCACLFRSWFLWPF